MTRRHYEEGIEVLSASFDRFLELHLPAYLGHTDEQAQAGLTSKREQARQWMRERGIEDLNDPLPPERLGKEGRR